eukprot:14822840-Heterocapsa_arctica.AAC.1
MTDLGGGVVAEAHWGGPDRCGTGGIASDGERNDCPPEAVDVDDVLNLLGPVVRGDVVQPDRVVAGHVLGVAQQ